MKIGPFVPVIAFAVSACAGEKNAPSRAREESPGLTPATSKSADPHTFELDLEARVAMVELVPGIKTKSWTYNGTVPGPLIDVAVGDRLVVHFKNSLPQPTTIHWHGIRLPNAMDGAVAVQNPVPPGGTFEYAFQLKDPGLYWFHPHHLSDEQVAKGLYGVIRVRGPNEPRVDHEQILVLSDARVDVNGAFPPDLDDYRKLSHDHKLHGRSGPTILVNGQANRVIDVQPGAIHRFRFLDTANLRFFNLVLPGHKFRVIGTDGGMFEKPYDVERLLIGPAERYDTLLIPKGTPGDAIQLRSDPYKRADDDDQAATPVATLRLSPGAPRGESFRTSCRAGACRASPPPRANPRYWSSTSGWKAGARDTDFPPSTTPAATRPRARRETRSSSSTRRRAPTFRRSTSLLARLGRSRFGTGATRFICSTCTGSSSRSSTPTMRTIRRRTREACSRR